LMGREPLKNLSFRIIPGNIDHCFPLIRTSVLITIYNVNQ
jgi:hypothetical protein